MKNYKQMDAFDIAGLIVALNNQLTTGMAMLLRMTWQPCWTDKLPRERS